MGTLPEINLFVSATKLMNSQYRGIIRDIGVITYITVLQERI